MSPCPPESALMNAWNTHKGTDDFKNSIYWATTLFRMRAERAAEMGLDPNANVATGEMREQRAEGSLWAAFMAGWFAAGGPDPQKPMPTIAELEAILKEDDRPVEIMPNGSIR